MIEHIVLPVYALYAAVNCASGHLRFFIALVTQIAVGNEHAFIFEPPVGITAHGVGEFVVLTRGIDKIIPFAELAYGRRLVKGVIIEGSAFLCRRFAV